MHSYSLIKPAQIPAKILDEIMEHYMFSSGMIAYYEAYSGEDLQLVQVLDSKQEIIALLPFLKRDDDLSYFGEPTRLWFNKSFLKSEQTAIFKQVIKFLSEKYIDGKLWLLMPDEFLHLAFGKISSIKTKLFGYVDLSLSDEEIRGGFRKSYRSLIDWGHKNINLERFDHSNADAEKFKELRLLHFSSAGRETRSELSWELQYELVSKGHASFYIGTMSGEAVTGALFLHDKERAFYAISAGRRDLMQTNVALSHCLIERSIFDSKALGLKYMEFGDVSVVGCKDLKLTSINKFKKGFCTSIKPRLVYEIVLG